MAAAYNIYGTTIPSLTLLVKLQSRLTRCRELLTNQACCKRGLSLVVRAVHQMRQKASIFFPSRSFRFGFQPKHPILVVTSCAVSAWALSLLVTAAGRDGGSNDRLLTDT